MLNTVLTVRAHQANSHRGYWMGRIYRCSYHGIKQSGSSDRFHLMGKHRLRERQAMLTNPKHLILKAPHPSPLSAYRGFFGSKPFSQTNDYLRAHGVEPIDWQIE